MLTVLTQKLFIFTAIILHWPYERNTHVPLSPSSIIWYQPMGGDALQLGR